MQLFIQRGVRASRIKKFCLFAAGLQPLNFELFYKIGNGIPKYNTLNNSWTFSVSPIVDSGFWNSIDIEKNIINESKSDLYFSNNDYQEKKVVFCRHPFGDHSNDLYSFNQIRPVVLFREPLDWMCSYYTKYGKKRFNINLVITFPVNFIF